MFFLIYKVVRPKWCLPPLLKSNVRKVYNMSGRQYYGRRATRRNPFTVSGRFKKYYKKMATSGLSKSVGSAARKRTLARTMLGRKRRNPMTRKVPKAPQGGAATFSRWGAVRAPSKRVSVMKKVGAANYFVTNDPAQLTVAEGFQDYQDFSIQSLAHLKIIAANSVGTSSVQPKQFLLESATAEYIMTNSSLATIYVDIYDVVRKRDQSGSSETAGPSAAWFQGVKNETAGGLEDGAAMIGSLPTDSRLFKDYFKVVQRTHIGLTQGGTHRHSIKLKSNELIDTQLLNTSDGDLTGITVYTLVCAYGQPASVPQEEAPSIVTTASGFIDIVRTVRYKYSWVADFSNNFVSLDNLSSTAGEQVVSIGAGAIVPNAKI